MLCLTRKTGETIKAGDITITVNHIQRGRVELGIQAPPHVKVLRGELEARPPRREATP